MFHDEDEYETVIHSRPCTACNGDTRKCNGACNGSAGYSLVRRKPEEIKRIKAEKQRKREDAILAEADAIRGRRGHQ
jgi:hypothetical protein